MEASQSVLMDQRGWSEQRESPKTKEFKQGKSEEKVLGQTHKAWRTKKWKSSRTGLLWILSGWEGACNRTIERVVRTWVDVETRNQRRTSGRLNRVEFHITAITI